jgi:hypothetical protein
MNTNELKVQMIRQQKTAEQLCSTLGISKSAWYRKIGGESQFTQGEIMDLRRELSLDDRQTALIFFDEEVS